MFMQNLINKPIILFSLLAYSLAAPALETDRNQKLILEGEPCTSNQSQGITECENLSIRQGTMKITAAFGNIKHQQQGIEQIEMRGEPVYFEQDLESGKQMTIVAQQINYDKKTETVRLQRQVRIVGDLGIITGEDITYNLLTQEMSTQADSEHKPQKFHMEIIPEDND